MSKMCIIAMKIMSQCKINMEIERKCLNLYCINKKNLFVGQFLHKKSIFFTLLHYVRTLNKYLHD